MDMKEAINLLHKTIDYEISKKKIVKDCNYSYDEPFVAFIVNKILRKLSLSGKDLSNNISIYFDDLVENGADYLAQNYKTVYEIGHAGKCTIYYYTNDLSFENIKQAEQYLKSQK